MWHAHQLFEMLIENPYCGNVDPRARLFAQFHASTTTDMKKDIPEIKQPKSRIRIIFATTALAMGIDAPDIRILSI